MTDEEKLDYLINLFTRRLTDDKDKRRLIEEQEVRLRQAEGGLFRDLQLPLVRGIAAVIDRLDKYEGADPGFVQGVRDELLELLELNGIREVPTDQGFDRAQHEAAAVRAEEGAEPGSIVEVWNRGYARDTWVFRPARVVIAP
ncbi:nucleotide exchange factor GrpE [Nonomuraea sp. NPDC050556]|uniref:nucleotide exchange factor GrpE n=1 Tax=Nonomuraea sp. NPDC050556 TaxID=3364369 RepID=UPI0037B03A1A